MEKQTEGPGHRRLLAWQEAKTLAGLTYEMCLKQRLLIDRGLADQLRRAAISIPSNIAEGNGRGSNKDSLRFLCIARGSLCELETQIEVCQSVKLLTDEDAARLLEQAARVGRLIGGLIHYRKQKTDHGDEPEVAARDLPP
jgi:four helix bundle protein